MGCTSPCPGVDTPASGYYLPGIYALPKGSLIISTIICGFFRVWAIIFRGKRLTGIHRPCCASSRSRSYFRMCAECNQQASARPIEGVPTLGHVRGRGPKTDRRADRNSFLSGRRSGFGRDEVSVANETFQGRVDAAAFRTDIKKKATNKFLLVALLFIAKRS